MAASSVALAALEAHLMRADYKKAFVLLEDVRTLLRCYPSLEVKLVRVSDVEGDSKWVVVCCEKYSRVEGNPVKPARLVFTQHPGYYVAPLRANGSAIETIFSQLKHGSRGTLTAVSYGPARAQLLTRKNVHGPHVRDEYRDAPLYIQATELPAHKRPRKA